MPTTHLEREHPAASPERARSLILAISNQKGGVGKTTTAVNLAAAMTLIGKSAVLIDLDPQGNASTALGVERAGRGDGTYSLIMHQRGYNAVVRSTSTPCLSIIPAEDGLSGAEIELVGVARREFQLAEAVHPALSRSGHPDLVLIDCPPSLNLLTLNALVAADAVLVPLQCEFLALEGLSQVTSTIDLVRQSLNPQLRLHGILLTMFDRRNNLSELVETDVRGFFRSKVYTSVIPRNVRLSEAPSHGKSVFDYDSKSAGAAAYLKLAHELLAREAVFAPTDRSR